MECEDFKFFGEWVHYKENDSADKKEAILYLELWKKFLIRKLGSAFLEKYEPVLPVEYGEQIIEREAHFISPLSEYGTLGFKMAFKKKKLPGEL